jgi:hypothetical protein
MKLTKFVSLLFLTFVFAGISFPLQAETFSLPTELAQSDNQNNSQVLEDKATNLLNSFFNKNFHRVIQMISPQLRDQVSIQLLQKEWLDATSQNGSFQEILRSKVVNTPSSDLVIVTVKFQNETNDWIVIFDDNQQIIGTDFPNSQSIEDIAVELVNSLAINKFDNARAYLAPFLKEQIFPQQVESAWTRLQQENGDFKKIAGTTTRRGSSLDDANMVIVTIEFAKNTRDMLILFNNRKNITYVDIFEK